MASNVLIYIPPIKPVRVRAGNLVQQLEENTTTAGSLKRVNSFGNFHCSYLWTFENFSQHEIGDHDIVKTAKTTFASSAWELGVNLRKRSRRNDFAVVITLNKESCGIFNVMVKWRMSFVDKNGCKQLIKEDEVQNSKGIYREVYTVGRNLLFGKSFEDLVPNGCLTICFELRARDMFSCQSTWKDDLGIDWMNSSPCLAYLSNDFLGILNNNDMADVVLNVGGQQLKAHKMILSARSKVFSAMFKHDMRERNENVVDIVDVEAPDMQNLLIYIYSGIISDVQVDRLLKLYAAADKYQVLMLKRRCMELMMFKLSEDNVWDVLFLAEKYSDEELKTSVKSFLMFNENIFLGEKWKKYSEENSELATEILNEFVEKALTLEPAKNVA